MIFVNSMSDLFHERVSDDYIARVFGVMAEAEKHTFQILTKRAERLAAWYEQRPEVWDLPNIWVGVSVEDRRYGSPRIPSLRRVASAVRFLSVEPLLEDLGLLDLGGIDWVIVGGESGPGARPMKPEWALSVRDQCLQARVPFFFKQWGGVRKKKAGRLLEDKTWDQMPERGQRGRLSWNQSLTPRTRDSVYNLKRRNLR
jgi:protein gp37